MGGERIRATKKTFNQKIEVTIVDPIGNTDAERAANCAQARRKIIRELRDIFKIAPTKQHAAKIKCETFPAKRKERVKK